MKPPAVEETEAEFQSAVIQLARTLGFRVAHFRAARTAKGWRTPVSADGAGFPDLLLCKPGRLLAVELKSRKGKLRPEQEAWLEALDAAGAEVHVWKPDEWNDITAALVGRPDAVVAIGPGA